jgi:hypothetical protein
MEEFFMGIDLAQLPVCYLSIVSVEYSDPKS